MLYDLLDTEGLYLGASSALNVVAAVELAKKLGPGKTIATILCDGAYRYQSRLFSKKWLQSKGLESAIPEHLKNTAGRIRLQIYKALGIGKFASPRVNIQVERRLQGSNEAR
ncbi:hypothetical protein NUW54_g14416 [Trametes sanguinea]|uniref:Uncharacterized protein n=1 Tax=Trametes sanguinea TaxID=158606 RepID=A0ACC1MD86_9APHY|nr:hypothetical protein NUW54_g14416 [Trametes sanguinea]